MSKHLKLRHKKEKIISDLYVLSGRRGSGKTAKALEMLDLSKPILALDSRGDMADKLGCLTTNTRDEFILQMEQDQVPQIFYMPGQEVFPVAGKGGDLDFFFIYATACHGCQILIDEIDELDKNYLFPASFRKMINASRKSKNSIYMTGHSIYSFGPKIRDLATFLVFKTESDRDILFLKKFNNKDTVEQVKTLEKYSYLKFPENE